MGKPESILDFDIEQFKKSDISENLVTILEKSSYAK